MKIYLLLNEDNTIAAYNFEKNDKSFIEYDISEDDYIIFDNKSHLAKFENNKIIYDFVKENNLKLISIKISKINDLKINLQSTDYKIIKCYEAFMRQLPLPYNLEELSTQREAWRAEINQLEEELKAL